MNKTWLFKDLNKNFYLQNKIIYLIDKLCATLNFDNILIGYDGRVHSERIATTFTKGLNKKYNAYLSDKPSSSSLLSHMTKNEITDIAVYVTGDYISWKTYGIKIKLNNGRQLTDKEIKKATHIMKEFHPSTYFVDYSIEAENFSVEKIYLRNIKRLFPYGNLNFKIAYNMLHYAGGTLNSRVLLEQGCKVNMYNSSPKPMGSASPYHPNSIDDLKTFVELSKADFGVILADGEQLIIQTQNTTYKTEDIALMYIEVLKQQLYKVVFSVDYPKLKKVLMSNNIKHEVRNKNPYKIHTSRTLMVANNNIIDTHYSYSMDSNYILLTILYYLNKHNLSFDDFYKEIEKKYFS